MLRQIAFVLRRPPGPRAGCTETADLSVPYPDVVEHYRDGHRMVVRSREGRATTEDLRTAMRHYRALFEELLESHLTHQEEVRHEQQKH